jgi:hypothetical protein
VNGGDEIETINERRLVVVAQADQRAIWQPTFKLESDIVEGRKERFF